MQIAKQIAGFTPGEAETLRKAIGKKIHELMASLEGKFRRAARLGHDRRPLPKQLWKDMQQSKDYSFNKAHFGLLRADRLPHGVPEGALPGAVHGRADLVRDEHEGPRAVLRQRVPRDGARGAAARRERVPGRLRRRRDEDPLRPERGQERGESACRAIVAAREEGGPFTSIWEFTDRVDPQVVNKRALESLVKCGALDSTGSLAEGDARRARARAAVGRAPAGRPARGAVVDLRPSAATRRRRAARAHHPPIPSERVREGRAARGWRRRRSASTSPSTRSTRVRDQLRRRVDSRSASSSGAATERC